MGESKVWYVAVYTHVWGRGHSIDEAKKRARSHGARGTRWYVVRLPAGAKDPYVDDFGGVVWTWEDGEPEGYEHKPLPTVAKGRSVKVSDLRRWEPE